MKRLHRAIRVLPFGTIQSQWEIADICVLSKVDGLHSEREIERERDVYSTALGEIMKILELAEHSCFSVGVFAVTK